MTKKKPKTATNREGVVLFDGKRTKNRDQERESSVYAIMAVQVIFLLHSGSDVKKTPS